MKMGVTSRAIWQLAGGSTSRSFADIFLKYGVGLIGPGDPGPWSPERYAHDLALQGVVGRFATEVEIGDVFLLRTGISTLCAVGIVASEYMYLEQFDDVCGWDLQHARRVRWYRLPQKYTFRTLVFGANPTRFSRTWSEEVVDFAERFLNSPPLDWQLAPLPPLPCEEPHLEDVPHSLQGIIAEANDLVPLLRDRQVLGELPSEDEMIAHFVVPFLRILGWPPEKIAVKWRYVDVALFRALPRIPDNCQFVIEAKHLDAGVEGALAQAKAYLEKLGVSRDVIVTDGIRYRVYSSKNDFEPLAYANLIRLKKSATKLFEHLSNRRGEGHGTLV